MLVGLIPSHPQKLSQEAPPTSLGHPIATPEEVPGTSSGTSSALALLWPFSRPPSWQLAWQASREGRVCCTNIGDASEPAQSPDMQEVAR